MGNGNTLAGAEASTTTSFRSPRELVERFDDHLDQLGWDSRSEAFRAFMSRELENIGVSPDGYLPAREDHQRLYRELLRVSNDRLIYNPRRHATQLANRTDTKKDELDAALFPLRRRGFVSQQCGAPGTGEVVYRVKPPEADPEQWVRREVPTA